MDGTKAGARGGWLRRRLRRARRWYRADVGASSFLGCRRRSCAPTLRPPTCRPALFDARYYLGSNPDVRSAGVDPLRHYLEHGWREGRRPNAWFDPAHYLAMNPDVRDAGIEPLQHFILSGAAEGRAPHSPAPDLQATLFDTGYYLGSNPDVSSAGVDPLRHYLEHGWREGRRPNAWFDPAHYLAMNPDVRDAGYRAAAALHPLGCRRGTGATLSGPDLQPHADTDTTHSRWQSTDDKLRRNRPSPEHYA